MTPDRSSSVSTGGEYASTQAFYGRWADLYDVVATRMPGVARIRRRAAAACRLDPGDTVVEMGTGTGANLPFLREAVGPSGTVVGVDVTEPVLQRARERTRAFDNVQAVRADATDPPVDDADAVLATFVVGMLDRPAAAVDRWCDLVGADGHVVLVNAASSDGPLAPVVNPVFRGVVHVSTPPTTKLRYEADPTGRLDAKVTVAHDRLRRRSGALFEDRALFGVVRTTGGRIRGRNESD